MVRNASCSSHQPQAAHVFWIQKWQLKPIRQNKGISKLHIGYVQKGEQYIIWLKKEATNLFRAKLKQCDYYRQFLYSIFFCIFKNFFV